MTIRKITFLVQAKETDEKSYIEIPFRMDMLTCDMDISKESVEKIWCYIKGYVAGHNKKEEN